MSLTPVGGTVATRTPDLSSDPAAPCKPLDQLPIATTGFPQTTFAGKLRELSETRFICGSVREGKTSGPAELGSLPRSPLSNANFDLGAILGPRVGLRGLAPWGTPQKAKLALTPFTSSIHSANLSCHPNKEDSQSA